MNNLTEQQIKNLFFLIHNTCNMIDIELQYMDDILQAVFENIPLKPVQKILLEEITAGLQRRIFDE